MRHLVTEADYLAGVANRYQRFAAVVAAVLAVEPFNVTNADHVSDVTASLAATDVTLVNDIAAAEAAEAAQTAFMSLSLLRGHDPVLFDSAERVDIRPELYRLWIKADGSPSPANEAAIKDDWRWHAVKRADVLERRRLLYRLTHEIAEKQQTKKVKA